MTSVVARAMALTLGLGLLGCRGAGEPVDAGTAGSEPAIAGQGEAGSDQPTSQPEPSPEQRRQAELTAWLATVDGLAELHRSYAEDCAGLATAIRSFHAEHGEALATASTELLRAVDADPVAGARVRTAMEAVMTVGMACRADPSFAAAQAELFDAPESGESHG